MVLGVIMYLVLLPTGILSLELLGNYRFWDSVSDQIVYDYSGLNHHGVFTGSYFFTDRGFTTNTVAYFVVETFFYTSNTQEAAISFWILCPDNSTNVSIESTTENKSVRAVYDQTANPYARLENLGTNIYSKKVSLYNEWNLYTSVFKLNSSTLVLLWDVNLYINLQLAYSATIQSNSFTINRLSVGLNYSKSRKNIIYELWWHTNLNIAELSFMISSRGNPTSPNEVDLPNHHHMKNSAGKDCSGICSGTSWDNKKQCINFTSTKCKYHLYQILTLDCLVFCPDDSCICSPDPFTGLSTPETLNCGCKLGYTKVSSNPPACISSSCTSYNKVGYKYTCTACAANYILDNTKSTCQSAIPNCVITVASGCSTCSDKYTFDLNGGCNKCTAGYVQVSENPFICDTLIDNCVSYTLSGNQWICSKCSPGYSLDPYYHCNLCDTGYTIHTTSPFVCIREIANCISYINITENTCSKCRYGYTLGCDSRCCECDISSNFIKVSNDPIVCIASIPHCTKYLKYDIDWGCNICDTGYTLDSLNRCDSCAEGYLEFWDEDFKCIEMIEGCLDYGYDHNDDVHICIECEEGLLLYNGKCEECDIEYYVSKADPKVCVKCPERCKSCKETQGELRCDSCEFGYVIVSNLCECDSKEFYIEGTICNPTPLKVTITSFTNILSLTFNKPLASHLSESDIIINLPKELEIAYLKYEILTAQDYEDYVISFSYSMNIDMVIDITLIFRDSVKDIEGQSLSDNTHTTQIHLESSFIEEIICDISCKECESKQNNTECTSCYDYAYITNGLCKCFIEESEQPGLNCPARCPDSMILNTQSRICENIGEPSDPVSPTNSNDNLNSNTTSIQAPAQTKGVVAACVSVSVISLNLNNVLSIVGTIQILSYILLYNLPLPSDIVQILKGLSILEFNPNIFEYFVSYKDTLVEYRFTRMEYTSEIILINSGKSLCIVVYMLFLYFIFKLLDRCITANNLCKKLIAKVLDSLKWSMIIGFLFSIYLELVVTSLINIKYADYSYRFSIIGYVISIIILVIFI
jgi:hypothetical protein